MYDNRIISKPKYVVVSVNSSSTDNNLTKKPYADVPASYSKRKNNSDFFDDTLHSTTSHTSSNDNSNAFSNELDNMEKLKSEQNSRIIQARFNQNTLNHSNSNKKNIQTEFHNKLNEAMTTPANIADLTEKIQLLNSLKKVKC